MTVKIYLLTLFICKFFTPNHDLMPLQATPGATSWQFTTANKDFTGADNSVPLRAGGRRPMLECI